MLRYFPRFCRPSALFSEHTELPVYFRILGTPAAHGSSVCNCGCSCGKSRYMFCGCRKNAHSFFFLRQSWHCLGLFSIFFTCRSSRMLFFCPRSGISPQRCQTYILIRTVIQFSRYTGKISSIYRQREGLFVDPLLEKFFKVRKSPLFWQIQRRKFVLYLFSHPSACQLHCLCEQIFLWNAKNAADGFFIGCACAIVIYFLLLF